MPPRPLVSNTSDDGGGLARTVARAGMAARKRTVAFTRSAAGVYRSTSNSASAISAPCSGGL